MKFRAVMHDPQAMREFVNIILTLSKLTKCCIVNISSDKIDFIVNEDSAGSAPLVWAEVRTDTNFSEYTMEGVNDKYQHIMLSFNPSNLSRAIAHIRTGAKYCKFKLTNVQYPCLTVEMEVQTNVSAHFRQIVHDVPVNIIPRVDWNTYLPPQVPSSKICLTFSSNRTLRNQIDKLKNLSPSMTVHVTTNGEMNIAAETDFSTITTRYRNLEIREINATQEERDSGYVEATCKVDCKKMAMFVSALQIASTEWSCGVIDDKFIHLEINVRQGVAVHSVIPAIST